MSEFIDLANKVLTAETRIKELEQARKDCIADIIELEDEGGDTKQAEQRRKDLQDIDRDLEIEREREKRAESQLDKAIETDLEQKFSVWSETNKSLLSEQMAVCEKIGKAFAQLTFFQSAFFRADSTFVVAEWKKNLFGQDQPDQRRDAIKSAYNKELARLEQNESAAVSYHQRELHNRQIRQAVENIHAKKSYITKRKTKALRAAKGE